MSTAAPCALTVGERLPRAARRALPKAGRKPWVPHQDPGFLDVNLLQRPPTAPPVLRGGASLARAGRAPIAVRVVEDTHAYAAADGTTWWSGGYAPIYEDKHGEPHFVALGQYLPDPRVLYCKVAGVQHHPAALHASWLKPGSIALLRPEPENPYDPNAVGAWNASGTIQAGYIPAEHSADVTSRIRAGEQLVAFVLREIRRGSTSGRRIALHALVMPAGELNLSMAVATPAVKCGFAE